MKSHRRVLTTAFLLFSCVVRASAQATHRADQIARDAYLSTESNLYVLSPEMSHVSREFAAGDPQFWSPKSPPAAIPAKPKEGDSTKKQ
jgi:hypothetical protein